MTFAQYLKRPPIGELLLVIFVAVGEHVGLGTLLWKTAPQLAWWQSYLISAGSAIITAGVLAWVLYQRHSAR
jgi:hypothetical protein